MLLTRNDILNQIHQTPLQYLTDLEGVLVDEIMHPRFKTNSSSESGVPTRYGYLFIKWNYPIVYIIHYIMFCDRVITNIIYL